MIVLRQRGARTVAGAGTSYGGIPIFSEFILGSLSGGHREDGGNDERVDSDSNEAYMAELKDITYLPPMDVSLLRIVLPEVGSPSGPPSPPSSTSLPGRLVCVDALPEHFFIFDDYLLRYPYN